MSTHNNPQQLFYNLEIQILPSSHRINGTARIVYPPDTCFYLNENLEIRSISTNGSPLPFHRKPEAHLPFSVGSAVVIDATLHNEIQIEYSGTIDEVINSVNMIQPDLVELALYAAWYPLFKSNSLFEYALKINLPSNYLTTTNGKLDQQQVVDGRTIDTWVSIDLCSDIVVIASPHIQKIKEEQWGTRIEIFFNKIPINYITDQRDSLSKAINRFSHYFGPAQTEGLLRYVISPRSGWGYSRPPLFVVPEEYMLSRLDQVDGLARSFHGSAHELAHFWWSIADASTPDDWINEGLAEYSAFRLSEELYGESFADTLLKEYQDHVAQCKTTTPIAETPHTSDDRYVNRYEKMTLIYLEARRRYGQEKLDRVFRALHTAFAGTRHATIAMFLGEINRQLGPEAQHFFDTALTQKVWVDPGKLP